MQFGNKKVASLSANISCSIENDNRSAMLIIATFQLWEQKTINKLINKNTIPGNHIVWFLRNVFASWRIE